MSLLRSRIVRCKVNVRSRVGDPLLNVANNATIEGVRGNATEFQFGFFDHTGEIYDLSEVQSLNLKIQPSQTPGGSVLADQTLAAEELDLTCTGSTWDDETKQHATFSFTNAQMNLDLGGAKVKTFWLVVTAILESGDEVTVAAGDFRMVEDNNATAGDPDENPGTLLTLEQADARYLPAVPLALTSVPSTADVGTNGRIVFQPDGSETIADGYTIIFEADAVTETWTFRDTPDEDLTETGIEASWIDTVYGFAARLNASSAIVNGYVTMDEYDRPVMTLVPIVVAEIWGMTIPHYADMAVTTDNIEPGVPDTGWPLATARGQRAIVTHSDGTFSEWSCARVLPVVWLPATAGIEMNRNTGKWERWFTHPTELTHQSEILPDQN